RSYKVVEEQMTREGEPFVVNPEGNAFEKLVSGAGHNNDLATSDPAIGYSLRHRRTGAILKYGETTLFNDLPTGGVEQSRYTLAYLKRHNAEFVSETSGTKAQMHDWQHQKILEYQANNKGKRPPLNRNNY